MLEGVSKDAPCRESARGEHHDWLAFTTYLQRVWIGVFCRRCGCDGVIQNSTRADWQRAHGAPSRPYRWSNGRVVRLINNRLPHWRKELADLDAALRQS